MVYNIKSPNNWLVKAGAYINKDNLLILPFKFLIVPMTEASHALDEYKSSLDIGHQIRIIQTIALNVRNAETAYFENWSRSIIRNNPFSSINSIFKCSNCFNGTVSPSNLRKYVLPEFQLLRDEINNRIIHSAENNYFITPVDYELVEKYYNTIFNINLIIFPEVTNLPIQVCKKCL